MKSEAISVAQRVLDDLKARAAANPAAALAIGAGIGWRLLKHPPIASALIGVGLVSLWEYASQSAAAAREKVGALAESTFNATEDFATSAREYAAEGLNDARVAAADISERAVHAVQRAGSTTIRDEDLRDQVLLGIAGAAVVAALGLAFQRDKDFQNGR
jgi:hypothetical protein